MTCSNIPLAKEAALPHLKTILTTLVVAYAFTTHAVADDDYAATFRDDIQPILRDKCGFCHGSRRQKGDVRLTGDRTAEQLADQQHLWFRVLDQLEFNQMPPEFEEQLTPAERDVIMNWIEGGLAATLSAKQRREGRASFRRLTRQEYLNTFRDLFGYEPEPSLLPQDSAVEGYVKTSAALPMTTDGAYGYYEIASDLSSKLLNPPLADNNKRSPRVQRWPALPSGESKGHILELPDGWMVSMNTDLTSGRTRASTRYEGWHKIRFHAYAYQTNGKPIPVGIHVGNQGYLKKIVMVPAEPTIVETDVFIRSWEGRKVKPIPMGIGVQVPKNHQASECKGPGLALQWLEIERPEQPYEEGNTLLAQYLTEAFVSSLRNIPRGYFREGGKGSYHYKHMTREEFREHMENLIRGLGERLFRRPVEQAEVDQILALVDKMLANEVEIKAMVGKVVSELLTHPSFFCVIESPGELDDYALASRLAYFLWNSPPDEHLMKLARQGKLRDPAELRRQTDRLLDDPKSARFVEDFLDQWLELREIDSTTPDRRLYPEYNNSLKFLSLRQTRETFRRMLKEDRSVREFVAPRTTLVDYRLAEHYSLDPDKFDEHLKPVSLPADSPYGGIWTQSAILKVTADGATTSPVKRGVWIAERLLGTDISSPPQNIEPIAPDIRGATTVREQLALHSSDASCAACHEKFDPYGFALESFDVTGRYRENYRILDPEREGKSSVLWKKGLPVDAAGEMPDGTPFDDIHGLRRILADRPERLARGVTRHLLTYATATPTGPLDRAAIDSVVQQAAGDDYGLRSLIHGIVQSKTFRWK